MAQTSYTLTPALGVPGMLVDTGADHFIASKTVGDTAGIAPGLGVFFESAGVVVAPLAADVTPADADAFKTNIASSASLQTFTGSDFNGVVGTSLLKIARKLDLILSSHANWDATTATLIAYDENGQYFTESLSIPDAGNATVTSVKYVSKIVSLAIPAQAGTSGTATVGTNAAGVLSAGIFAGITCHSQAKEPGVFADTDMVGVMRNGRIWVETEDSATVGGAVYVRFVTTGNEVAGAFRASLDSTDCVAVPGLRWATTRADAGIAAVEINLPAS